MPKIDFSRDLDSEAFAAEPLRYHSSGLNKTQPFPSSSSLKSEQGRAEALHFFANHELQAIELMALMLLKFPDITPKLQRSLVATIKDEQLHFKLYEKRMADFGLKFGDLGTSRYFWDQLSQVNSIEEFMVGMSLTFEQANLDFALHYAQLFYQSGDEKTSTILKQVYEDELRHVQLGVSWANEWRGAKSLWEYHLQFIPGAMSPERAKGPSLDIASRIQAGFPQDYIQSLATYSRSKSRNPDLYWFNADCTSECVGTETKAGKQIEADLATLMHVFAGSYNQVLVAHPPSEQFLVHLKNHNFPVPHFVTTTELAEKKQWQPRTFVPWGQSNRAEKMTKLHTKRILEYSLDPLVYSKSFAAVVAQSIDPEILSFVCHNVEDVNSALNNIREIGFAQAMIKADYASSGQGNHIVSTSAPNDNGSNHKFGVKSWPVIAEPFLAKVLDLSSHATIGATGSVKWNGETYFVTTKKGQYTGSFVGPKSASYLKKKLWQLDDQRHVMPNFRSLLDSAIAASAKNLFSRGFIGPFSIDHFFYRDAASKLCLRSLVEINPRLTMGRLALQLSDRISPNSYGFFSIKRSADQFTASSITEHESAMAHEFDEIGKIKMGHVFLSDVWKTHKWRAELEVSENPQLAIENNLPPLNILD